MPSQSPAFEAASELLHLMIARVTDGGEVQPRAFREARATVLADPVGKRFAPECMRICREPDNVWSYVKGRTPSLDTYASRRSFLTTEFEPLLSALEQFGSAPLDDLVSAAAGTLDAASVTAAWTKALERRSTDPDGAITAARTLLESVCKTILDDAKVEYAPKDDLPKLYRKASEVLTLTPSGYADDAIRRILGGVTTAVEGIGSLRNRHGDAHGEGRSAYRLSERHSALVVNLAGALAVFLIQTFEDRHSES